MKAGHLHCWRDLEQASLAYYRVGDFEAPPYRIRILLLTCSRGLLVIKLCAPFFPVLLC
jgi:hypothetical protein